MNPARIMSRSRIQPVIEKYNLFSTGHMTMDDRVDQTRKAIDIKPIKSSIVTTSKGGLPGFFITFTSTDVSRDGDDWTITGDLTIKGVTKPISVPFEFTGSAQDPFGNTRIGFEGEATLLRKDWGLSWNAALETGGVLVSEKVTLEFELSLVKNA